MGMPGRNPGRRLPTAGAKSERGLLDTSAAQEAAWG